MSAVTGAKGQNAGWPTYGGDAGGQHFSGATSINRQNVHALKQAWVYHTHALDSHRPGYRSAAFEATPILFDGLLYFSTPFDQVIALDPTTGLERWTYDPHISDHLEGELVTSRGVAAWRGKLGEDCSARIFVATLDGRLGAVDAKTGKPCEGFGQHGSVNTKAGLAPTDQRFAITSAPTVIGDVLVTGSSISDNFAVEMPHGTVRAFDARTGKPLWTWEPIPWADKQAIRTGAGNNWATISADPQMGLLFLPTGSASPDYYGGLRPGDGRDADSVVALDAKTGRKVWAFQLEHHNLWDYDVPSEPLLFTWHNIPAVAVTTKTGMVFILDRRTGLPLVPVEERPVPASDVPGEKASATQPFSSLPPLASLTFPVAEVGTDRDEPEAAYCREQISKLRYNGLFTPPSLQGSLVFPGAIGGVNWGGGAYDPGSGNLYANVNRLPYAAQLIPGPRPVRFGQRFRGKLAAVLALLAGLLLISSRKRASGALLAIAGVFLFWYMQVRWRPAPVPIAAPLAPTSVDVLMDGAFGQDHSPQFGAGYSLYRHPIVDHHNLPCTPAPWGLVAALNLQTGKMSWQQTHGTLIAGKQTGSVSLGGLMVTGGGLVFTAATKEPLLRAYNSSTGDVLWQAPLPVPAQASPMTYQVKGRQYVVIAAGGSGLFRVPTGDALVAFSLQRSAAQ